jgi:hypothetical protein
MTAPYNPIALFQQDLADRLAADEYFSDITVLTERTADLDNTIARALKLLTVKGSKIGVAVVVGLFTADADQPNVPGPTFSNASTRVTVFENPLINGGATGTGKAAVDIAARVAQVLHHYLAGGIGQTCLVAGEDAIQPVPASQLEIGTIAYQVRVDTALDSAVLDKVAPVAIAAAGAGPVAITLTCGTSGAAIYYTLDRSYPWSGGTTATLYTTPFNVSTAALLRAVAHKTGMAASDAAAADITIVS